MNKILVPLLSLFVGFATAQNIVTNSGFESGMSNWNKNIDVNSGANATFSNVDNANSGFSALNVTVDNLGKNPWDIMLMQDLQTMKGNNYELSLFAKADTSGKKVRLQFQNTTYTSKDIELTTDWAKYTFAITAKEDDLQFVIQFFEQGQFQVDDITVMPIEAPAQDLIANGSFEEEGAGWLNLKDNGANAIFSYSDEAPKEGKKALLTLVLVKGKNLWDIQSIADFPAERYKKYRMTFYAKSNSAGAKLRAQIQKTTYTSQDFTLTTDWKEYEFTFNAKENDMQAAFHYLDTGLYYIDGVKMEKLSKGGKTKKKKKKKR